MFSHNVMDDLTALFIEFIAFERSLVSQIFIQGDSIFTANVNFGKERERYAVVNAAEFLNLIVVFRFLCKELIAREA